MTPETLISGMLLLPLIIAAGVGLAGRFPNLREGVTLIGAGGLFFIVIHLAMLVSSGQRPELYIGEAAPGLALAFRLEPLGALFAIVASGLCVGVGLSTRVAVNVGAGVGVAGGSLLRKNARSPPALATTMSSRPSPSRSTTSSAWAVPAPETSGMSGRPNPPSGRP